MKCKLADRCPKYEPCRVSNPYRDLICEGDVEDLTCLIDEECHQSDMFEEEEDAQLQADLDDEFDRRHGLDII